MLLISRIDRDLTDRPVKRHRLVFLGDYVDRGPDNRGTLEVLCQLQDSARDCVFLLGNHDERVVSFIERPEMVWDDMMKWGGAKTLADYGVVGRGWESRHTVSERFRAALPDSHLAFLKSLQACYSAGDYFFCHAGVRPGIALAEQQRHDLIWIRKDFLLHQGAHEKIVVHGHTRVDVPDVQPNRINVDTGCWHSGVLTAVVLEADGHRFINTG